MIGNGPTKADLQDFVLNSQLRDRVTFLDWCTRDELSKHLLNADVFVLPSLAAGVPLLATNVLGNNEFVENSVNGILVDRGDSATMQDALIELIQDSSLRSRLGTAARLTAEKRGWDETAEVHVNLMSEFVC